MKLSQFLTPYTKVKLKGMKGLNVNQETIKTLQEKTGSNLFDLGCSNYSIDMSLEAREAKTKMNYWDLLKIKSFCTAKETINKIKRQPTEPTDQAEWEKIFANDISVKTLVSKSIKNLPNSAPKKQIMQ